MLMHGRMLYSCIPSRSIIKYTTAYLAYYNTGWMDVPPHSITKARTLFPLEIFAVGRNFKCECSRAVVVVVYFGKKDVLCGVRLLSTGINQKMYRDGGYKI